MILLKISAEISPYKLREFRQAVTSLLGQKIQEPGLFSAGLFQTLENEHAFCYMEEWGSREDMEVHFQTDRFRALLGAMHVLGQINEAKIITSDQVEDMALR